MKFALAALVLALASCRQQPTVRAFPSTDCPSGWKFLYTIHTANPRQAVCQDTTRKQP